MATNISTILTLENFLRKRAYTINYGIDTSKSHKLKINREYIVPEYQREIRWEPYNAELLINDFLEESKFIGTILLSCHKDSKYEIIDGQQRLTVLFMLIHSLRKKLGKEVKILDVCKYKNCNFTKFYEIMNMNFDKELIKEKLNSNMYKEYLESDALEQMSQFEILWNAIDSKLLGLSSKDSMKLMNNIYKSEINIILNLQEESDPNRNICVNYYLDINDRAVKLDNEDIFKGYLFKIEYDNMTERWAKLQKHVKELDILKISYKIMTLFEHYIGCKINEKIGYKINNLKKDFKLCANIDIENYVYEKGTHILDVVQTPEYATEMIDNIEDYLNFLKMIVNSGNTPGMEFKKLFTCKTGKKVDSVTIDNAFTIVNNIVRNDNEVPKILLMKYYFEVLKNDKCVKADYDCIYNIYVASIMFILCESKKESDKFKKIVLQKEWKTRLKNIAIEYLRKGITQGNYKRRVLQKGIDPKNSGQYLPKDVTAVYQFFGLTSDASDISIKKQQMYEFFSNKNLNTEHFFVNQSYKYEFTYGTKAISTKIDCPEKIKKYITYTGNYLIIEKNINSTMNDGTIGEKMKIIQSALDEGKNIGSGLSEQLFTKIKKVFKKYPDLSAIDDIEEAKALVIEYYEENFPDEYEEYIKEINNL